MQPPRGAWRVLKALFDLALSRVARAHYITGKAAIPYPDVTTGG